VYIRPSLLRDLSTIPSSGLTPIQCRRLDTLPYHPPPDIGRDHSRRVCTHRTCQCIVMPCMQVVSVPPNPLLIFIKQRDGPQPTRPTSIHYLPAAEHAGQVPSQAHHQIGRFRRALGTRSPCPASPRLDAQSQEPHDYEDHSSNLIEDHSFRISSVKSLPANNPAVMHPTPHGRLSLRLMSSHSCMHSSALERVWISDDMRTNKTKAERA
jgi:hypothetical protein